ncbi:MAG: ComF family protein [Vicinamibacterales bacterium]
MHGSDSSAAFAGEGAAAGRLTGRGSGRWGVLRRASDALLCVIFAPCCAACRNPLEAPAMSAVCDACWNAIRPPAPPFCRVCGDALVSWRTPHRDGERCPQCRLARRSIACGRALGHYDGALRDILHAFKYEGRRSIGKQLSALMRRQGQAVLAGADVVVPVPLHWRRRWRRGFNQSDELASGLGLPVLPALRRRRHTSSQADLPAHARQANVRNAFRVRRGTGARVRGACVVLVDDVSTTGATLEACAEALVRAGAREVRTLTAARVATRLPAARPR